MKILAYGHCPLDRFYRTALKPPLDIDRLGAPCHEDGGGNAANSACLLGSLGHAVFFFGRIGTDEAAQKIIASFKKHRVRTDYLLQAAGQRTKQCYCLVDEQGERRFLIDDQNAAALPTPDEASQCLAGSDFDILVTELPDGVSRRLAAKIPIIAYIGQIFHGRTVEARMLQQTHILVASERYVRSLCALPPERPLQHALLRKFPTRQLCIVTLGAKGIIVRYRRSLFSVPSSQIDVVDTTGAGDAFMGALLHHWCRLSPAPDTEEVSHCVRRAIQAACHVCGGVGARYRLEEWARTGGGVSSLEKID